MTLIPFVFSVGSRSEPLCISGVYPRLAAFNSRVDGAGGTYGSGGECGIGAVVPWAGKLWFLTYSPHCPTGSDDKLFTVDETMRLSVCPESVGGTPAGRLIHRETQQLFIGPYAIDRDGNVRVIPYSRMPGRHTAVARHLTDPANRVYYLDMEGRVYEVDVHTLEVTLLFTKPTVGWHAKGGYTGQGRLILSNNGELAPRGMSYEGVLAGEPPRSPEDNGSLAEWDGRQWRIVERRQFTEVTGPGGIFGAPDDTSPMWAVGWDRRSVILKLLDGGRWHTYRLPKGTHTYDGYGGCYTEWPRIREIAPGKLMLDMHGLFWDFPKTFAAADTGGLRPLATHHRYIPDFCHWNGRVVLASDDASLMQNPMVGQAQSNLWFGTLDELLDWGPRAGWGGPWRNDFVEEGASSVPFAIGGFPRRCLHLAVGGPRTAAAEGMTRCADRFDVNEIPEKLRRLPRVAIARGDYHRPAPGYAFTVNRPVVVYLAVDDRPKTEPAPDWQGTGMTVRWGGRYTDSVFRRQFPAGRVEIPPSAVPHEPDAYGLPHLCFVEAEPSGPALEIAGVSEGVGARVVVPEPRPDGAESTAEAPVMFAVELDRRGDGQWEAYRSFTVPFGGYCRHTFEPGLEACWLRVRPDRACVATAFLHLGEAKHERADAASALFAGLADVEDADCIGGLVRPGKHNRNLQFLMRRTHGDVTVEMYHEVDVDLSFSVPAEDRSDEVRDVAAVTKDFAVDAASVIMHHKGVRYRLPKGHARYDTPFACGWPRGIRECESERYLMNIHGTFYEKPREGGLPRIKPVASHRKQILDFCTWRGLLVLSGIRPGADADGHCFSGPGGAGLWFGGIDDLWKLGKPVGRGGPWLGTAVDAGEPSDPYLMTNYDRKRVELSHNAAAAVVFTIEVDVDHSGWHVYGAVSVAPGQTVTHEFPAGYGAHWVRLRADTACAATAWFVYE